VIRKQVSVISVLSQVPLNKGFRQALTGHRDQRWLHLCSRLIQVWLTTQLDAFVWKLTISDIFTVKSLYLDYMNDHTQFLGKYIWKMKIPLKDKNLYVVLVQKGLLTKDNLTKRNWQGCNLFCFLTKMNQYDIYSYHVL
jgi:hypothetical protein